MDRVHDISVPIRDGMAVFAGDPDVRIEKLASLADGDVANVSHVSMSVHTGTHVDAPLHFLEAGAGVEAVDPSATIGPAWVADLTALEDHVGARELESAGIPEGTERLLLRTRNSQLWAREDFSPDYLAITADGAGWIAERGLRLIGIDYLSVSPREDPAPTHRILLEAGVVILEGVDLRGVQAGGYVLHCLPLRLDGRDGAPARALLSPEEV
jgi:arylformamidase